MIQTIGNACGTVGLLHALGNNLDAIPLEDGFLKDFFASTKGTFCEQISSEQISGV